MSNIKQIEFIGSGNGAQIRLTILTTHPKEIVQENSKVNNTHVVNLKKGQLLETIDDDILQKSLKNNEGIFVVHDSVVSKSNDSNKTVIGALNTQISDLENQNKDLVEKVSKLESENQNLSKQISDLENQNKDLVEKVSKFNRSKKTDDNS